MRKISLIMVVFVLTASAWADVTITVEPNATDPDPCSFNILYEVTGNDATVGVRAIALDIFLDTDVNIVEVNDFHAGESLKDSRGYGIFPSNFASKIDPEDPDWDADGYTPLGNEVDYPDDTLGGLDTNGITVELGSLYEDTNDPCNSGLLLEIVVGAGAFNKVSLALNLIRGGIVLEDTNEPNEVILVDWDRPVDCLIGGRAHANEHLDWTNWGKPDCWCYCRQCRGDADGIKTGPYWVTLPDLGMFAAAYRKNDTILATIPNGICCDVDHKKTGPYRVTLPDLGILANYYRKSSSLVPNCDLADPAKGYPAPYTGPYNFWCDPTNGCPGVCP